MATRKKTRAKKHEPEIAPLSPLWREYLYAQILVTADRLKMPADAVANITNDVLCVIGDVKRSRKR